MPAVIAYATCSWTQTDWTATQMIELVDQYSIFLLLTKQFTRTATPNGSPQLPFLVQLLVRSRFSFIICFSIVLFRVYGWTVARTDLFAWVKWLRELIIVPTDLSFYLTTSNERVHQNGTLAWVAPGAVSGATHLLEAVALFCFLFCFLSICNKTICRHCLM